MTQSTENIDTADTKLEQAISELPRSLEAPDHLWWQLEKRLQPAAEPHQRKYAAPLALVASALVVAFVLVYQAPEQRAPDSQLITQSAEAQLVTAYEESIGLQLSALNERPDNWPYLEQQLKVFRDAVDEIRDALRYQPDEPRLLSHLQDIYQQQMAWLQAVHTYNGHPLS